MKADSYLNTILLLSIPLVAILMALLLPSLLRGNTFIPILGFVSSAIGILLLIVAKMPQLKKGVFFTFGPSPMGNRNRNIYLASYLCIGIGAFLIAIFLLVNYLKNFSK